ncbi:hypothetical protein SPRG_01409 [Saprolegnia parasitica CBS 223.65]|uniref:Peptidase M14 domain-containing protein n=1 Tax=Saprolegnia parasitica (strain CBS 223.65) TaxID=695850 RepID=A0A067CTV7_SAPPC|nr:hypothetical protein SPRG_01409 [Saprolegnia parasitica CBS 223.65]KDO34139.1 hypothetical protein SPRG_01409 [Saprolegnia parasitica CBS 223.65]|eukprot:XP_012195016.1 hypothetical protein SPRG_01409 [Saprolegnia parasitica CBS 223.65]
MLLRLITLLVATAAALHSRHSKTADYTLPPVFTPAYLKDVSRNVACHNASAGYEATLRPGNYTSNGFFDCFRTRGQIDAFLATLVAQNRRLLTPMPLATSIRGVPILAYKLSIARNHTAPSIYVQSMMHAREWVAGSSNLYALASFLDDLTANRTPPALAKYDMYFVPIVNVDGYDKTWSGDDDGESRYTRKDAHEVDLNRNFPTLAFNHDHDNIDSEAYPGTSPLSEPESKGIADFISAIPMDGFFDIHTYSALVLYPFGDTLAPPRGNRYKVLSQQVADALNNATGITSYEGVPAYELYPCYGTFIDYAYRKYEKAALTVEIAGSDFVEKVDRIRLHGAAIYDAQNVFASGLEAFNANR